ncbi:MAG: hypothetical protein WCC18_19120 [Candidatus Acidiferrales bacterium]
MKPQRITAIVVHEDIPEYGEPGEAQLLLPSGEIRYIQIDRRLGPGAAVELFQTPIPRDRDELIEHMQSRCPQAQRGRLHTAITLEYKNVVMVLTAECFVIQRRGKGQAGALFSYSPAEVERGLTRFFEEVRK